MTFSNVSVPAVIAWAVGSTTALYTSGLIASFGCKWGLPAVNGMAVTAIVYLVAKLASSSKSPAA